MRFERFGRSYSTVIGCFLSRETIGLWHLFAVIFVFLRFFDFCALQFPKVADING